MTVGDFLIHTDTQSLTVPVVPQCVCSPFPLLLRLVPDVSVIQVVHQLRETEHLQAVRLLERYTAQDSSQCYS